MTETDAALGELFTKLEAQLKAYQNKKALKKIEEILKVSDGDKDAIRCKVYLLIQETRFSDVLAVLHGRPAKGFELEKAYCLYRVGKLQEALQGLKLIKDAKMKQARLELEGQIHYRMGNHRDAIKVYRELVGDLKVDSMEVKANMLAAFVAGNRASDIPDVSKSYGVSASDGFEISYNQACGLVDAGDHKNAKEQLELALREGRESLFGEELSENDIDLELLPVSIQLAYVNGVLGSHQDAMDGYEAALDTKGIDQHQRAIVEQNIFADKSYTMPDQPQKKVIEDGLKKVEKLLDEPSITKLSPLQKCIAMCNHALLFLLAGKWDGAKDTLDSLTRSYPSDSRVKMVKIATLAKEKKFSEAEKVAQEIVPTAGAQLTALLIRAQLLAASGSLEDAVTLLSSIEDPTIKNRGALVATRATLLERVGDFEKCQNFVRDALTWWKKSSGNPRQASVACGWCLEQLAGLKLREGAVNDASQLYQEALDCQVDEIQRAQIISKLSRVLAITDPMAVVALESELQPMREFSVSDIDQLEGSTKGMRRKDEGLKKRPATDGTDKPERKRVRKPRYPKDFDPENPGPKPDPERWMPKWQRSGRKKGGRRREDKKIKGSQGAGKVNESLDRTKASSSEPSSSGRNVPARPQRPSGAGKRRGGRK